MDRSDVGVRRRRVGIKERILVVVKEVGRAGSLNNSIFCQVAELHVAKGFPWAHHCDVCAETLHAGDVVTESDRRKGETIVSFTIGCVRQLMFCF